MLKVGDVREDGKVFRGYRKGANGRLEHWVSAESFAKRQETVRRHDAKRNADPERKAKLNAYACAYVYRTRRNRPELYMFHRVKTRAKKDGVPFTLTREDIHIPDRCPVLGIALEIGGIGGSDNSPELDKVIPALGYVPGNVVVISRRANRIKSNATLEELQKIASFYTAFMLTAAG
jgi:hypothetical protein